MSPDSGVMKLMGLKSEISWDYSRALHMAQGMQETTVEVAGVTCHVVYTRDARTPLTIGLSSAEIESMPVYGSLAYSLPSATSDSGSVTSLLMKNSSDGAAEVAKSLASLIAVKFSRPVFVNCSVGDPADRVLLSTKLVAELKTILDSQ